MISLMIAFISYMLASLLAIKRLDKNLKRERAKYTGLYRATKREKLKELHESEERDTTTE